MRRGRRHRLRPGLLAGGAHLKRAVGSTQPCAVPDIVLMKQECLKVRAVLDQVGIKGARTGHDVTPLTHNQVGWLRHRAHEIEERSIGFRRHAMPVFARPDLGHHPLAGAAEVAVFAAVDRRIGAQGDDHRRHHVAVIEHVQHLVTPDRELELVGSRHRVPKPRSTHRTVQAEITLLGRHQADRGRADRLRYRSRARASRSGRQHARGGPRRPASASRSPTACTGTRADLDRTQPHFERVVVVGPS